jgi:hypothetical protein
MKSVGADERKLKEIILRVGKKEFIAYFSKYWAKQGI